MNTKKFLLGHGELLTSDLHSPKVNPSKVHPYTSIDEVVDRLTADTNIMLKSVLSLNAEYCPMDMSVFKVILHPAYTSKSYFPIHLFNELNLRPIGSRSIRIIPQKWTRNGIPQECSTFEIFLAGKIKNIENLSEYIAKEEYFNEFRKIESIRAFSDGERLKGDYKTSKHFEIVLHSRNLEDDNIIKAFDSLSQIKDISLALEKRIYSGGLCFIPASGELGCIEEIEKFSFLRVARPIPRIRGIIPELRNSMEGEPISISIPQCPLDLERKVAVFDGGCHVIPELNGWVKQFKWKDTELTEEGKNHGSWVNSALLFGSINKEDKMLFPVSPIDNYAVITKETESEDPYLLFDVISRIKQIMEEKDYEFMNLSLGPDLPIDDDEVHVWTAILDELLADGKKLLTIAVGNNGNRDIESGNARVQVPSDAVNALSIGSSTKHGNEDGWERASYSAMGPGRMPGKIKPDVLSFGGSIEKLFFAFDPKSTKMLNGICGTSFAAPAALRTAVMLKNNFKDLSPLGIKTLMIHRAYRKTDHNHDEFGWGCLSNDFDDFVVCKDSEVTILYQGILNPGKYIKVPIPFPDSCDGKVSLTATFCYATSVDPQDPTNYTRSGLDIRLRPKISKIKGQDIDRPESKTFFDSNSYATEEDLRRTAMKWDTVLHGTKIMFANSIKEPFFEIHYNARIGGGGARSASKIPYALVVTLKAPKVSDIYEQVIEKYPILSPIEIKGSIEISI